MNELISIIVPVYKVEEYLDKCVNSIINQTYTNLEIILVDDGSPDRCGEICDEFAKADDRIKVIHKKNGGLSDARNSGIDSAQGKYIAFVDSDDYISEEMIYELYNRILQDNSDMAMCSIEYVDGSFNPIGRFNEYNPVLEGIFTRNEIFEKIASKKGEYFVVACNKLYKKDIFNNIRFPYGKCHEDEFTIHWILHQCDRISCTAQTLYNYVQRENSIMSQKYNIERLDAVEAFIDRLNYFEKFNVECRIDYLFDTIMSVFYNGYTKLDLNDISNKKRLNQLRKELKKISIKKIIDASTKQRVRIILFNLAPGVYIYLMKKHINKLR